MEEKDWASGATDWLDKKEETEQGWKDRAAQERKILEEQGPGLWDEIRREFDVQRDAFNQREGRDVLTVVTGSPKKVTVFAKMSDGEQREMTAAFTDDYSIEYHAGVTDVEPDRSGKFKMSVTNENELVLLNKDNVAYVAKTIADHALNALIGRP